MVISKAAQIFYQKRSKKVKINSLCRMLAAVLCRPVSIKLFYHRCVEKGMGIFQHYITKYDNIHIGSTLAGRSAVRSAMVIYGLLEK